MKRVVCLALGLVLLLGSGCSRYSFVSKNMRVAYARATVGVGTTAYLDAASDEEYEVRKFELIAVSTAMINFVESGQISALPLTQAELKLEKYLIDNGWQAYYGIVDSVFAYAKQQSVDLSFIDENNMTIIIEGFEEIKIAASISRFEWRPEHEVVEEPDLERAILIK